MTARCMQSFGHGCFSDHTTYLDVRKLAQVSIHGDESVIHQLLVVVGPQLITVLQHTRNKKK